MNGRGGGGRGGGGRGRAGGRAGSACNFWTGRAGSCKFGADCRYSHDAGGPGQGQADGNGGAPGGRGRGGRGRGRSQPAKATAADVMHVRELAGGHRGAVRAMTLSGPMLYTGGHDGALCVWDSRTWALASAVNLGGEIDAILIESGWLFAGVKLPPQAPGGHSPGVIRAYLIEGGTTAGDMAGHTGAVYALAVFAPKAMLLSAGQDGAIRVWVTSPGAPGGFVQAGAFSGHAGPVSALRVLEGALPGGGGALVSCGADRSLRVWDLQSGAALQSIAPAHDGVMLGLAPGRPSPADHLFSASLDGAVRVWRLAGGAVGPEPLFTFQSDAGVLGLESMVDASGAPVLLAATKDGPVQLYDLPTFGGRGALLNQSVVPGPGGGPADVRVLLAGPDGYFFSGDDAGLVQVWRWRAP